MPRKARIDAPGALQHIICRGIERRKIFIDNADKNNFVARLGRVISETKIPCYAWALISNNFNKQRKQADARNLLCYWAVSKLELPGAAVAHRLKMSKSAVRQAVRRGERITSDMKLKLFED